MWKILLNSIILTSKVYLKFFINQRHIRIMINMWNLSQKKGATMKCPWSHVLSRYIVSQECFYALKWCTNSPCTLYYTCGFSGEWRKLSVLSNKQGWSTGWKMGLNDLGGPSVALKLASSFQVRSQRAPTLNYVVLTGASLGLHSVYYSRKEY